jgi:hypothetical protein
MLYVYVILQQPLVFVKARNQPFERMSGPMTGRAVCRSAGIPIDETATAPAVRPVGRLRDPSRSPDLLALSPGLLEAQSDEQPSGADLQKGAAADQGDRPFSHGDLGVNPCWHSL